MKNNTLGIDIGSRFTKLVMWNAESRKTLWEGIGESGTEPISTVEELLNKAKTEGVADIRIADFNKNVSVCSTGYGRKLLKTPYISEISCHAKAVAFLFPEAEIVIDIGGQDSKVIMLDDKRNVADFVMNDKCAAGTGSFFESVARLFKIPIEKIGDIALSSTKILEISSTCVVFAESEIITHIHRQNKIEDIVMAVHRTVGRRIVNMLPSRHSNRIQTKKISYRNTPKAPPSMHPDENQAKGSVYVLTGGVANNKAMKYVLEQELSSRLIIPPNPSITGALGAAIF
ncbi:MAG: acyl-CoA dehydratase activase, partial [Candidatus Dojkabacteria bacterium]